MKISIGKYPKKDGEQKKSIRIDPWDTWSMDHTLADIILPMLKQLRKTQHGAPCTDDEDVHFKRWDWIMKEMIWTFNEHAKDREPNFWIKKPKHKWASIEGQDWKEMVTTDKGIYDEEKAKAYWKRKSNGFRLFGKYYQNLWD
jgi:hypothetical protein